ncbi:MAG: SpoIID/LytB domain-containing protein, partial [Chloroflexota bacterium]|nr:SpoIID/LytB domain-containing protein [Chloroflexota bacterium]
MRVATLGLVIAVLLAQASGAAATVSAVPLLATYQATPPTQMGAGVTVAVAVRLTNAGTETWLPTGATPVDLGYHWSDAGGNTVVWDGARSSIGSAPVAAGGVVSVTAQISAPTKPGTYMLQLALVKEGAAWFPPSQPFPVTVVPAYSAQIAPPQLPSLVSAVTYTVPVTLTNVGTQPWNASGANPVSLSYHWHDAAGNAVVWDGLRTPLPSDVAPGASVTLQASVATPPAAGSYTLTLDLVREGVAWFASLGSAPTRVSAVVAPVRFAAAYGAPPSVAAYIGQGATVAVTVTNAGNVAWGATTPVNLGYHIVDAAGNAVVWDGARVPLGSVAPGASTTVQLAYTAPLTVGTYTLVIDAVREGIAWFSSIGAPGARIALAVTSGFGIGYGATTTPALATIGATLSLSVEVDNYGPRSLPAAGTNPVHLSYHLYTASGAVVAWDGARASLPADLAPGQGVSVPIDVQMPSQVGSYVLAWDLVQEGVAWLSQVGVASKKEQVSVQPGVTFYGKGFGHGLGMSQWGAQGMATGAGGRPPMTATQIVTYYYPGTQLGPIPAGSLNTVVRVLLSQPSSQGRYSCGAAYFSGNLANLVSNGGFKVLNEGANNAVVFTAGPSVTVQIQAIGGVVKVFDQATPTPTLVYQGAGPIVTVPLDPTKPTDWLEKGWYRGNFRFTNLGDTLRVIDVVNYDDYVRGVVPLEMLTNWALEAYKAQAIAARSYAYTSYKGGARDYDVSDDQSDQCYGGVQMASGRAIETAITNTAVDQTLGMFAEYGGQPIRAYFASSDGGYTESIGCW